MPTRLVLASKPVLLPQPFRQTTPAATAGRSHPIPSVSVVVPALNEAKNLPYPYLLPLVPERVQDMRRVAGYSTYSSVDVARARRPDIPVVEQKGRGHWVVLRCGFAAGADQIIFTCDAVGSVEPHPIGATAEALVSGGNFATGSCFLPGCGTVDMELHCGT